MTIDRAIEILTPDRRPDYSPGEYEEALEMARQVLDFYRVVEVFLPIEELKDDGQ
jgi:hypothetical protein